MANNLDQQKEMNELLKQQNKLWAAQEKNLKNQTALMVSLVAAMKGISFKEAIDQVKELNDMLSETSDLGTEAGTSTSRAMQSAAEAAEEALDQFEKLNPMMGGFIKNLTKVNVAAMAGQGAMRGFSFSIDMFKNIASGIAGLVSSLFQIGVAILSIPFRMWDAFLGMQTSGSNEWRQALEDVRKAFGDLTKNSAADLLQMEKNLNGVIAQTGLSTYRIFGNRAEQLNALREYATKLGAAFNVLSSSIASSADETERFAAYMKGLGMSDAGIKGVGERAVALGTTVNEIGRQITTFAFQVGEAFGINGRQISADVGEMIGDISHFGNLTVKEMTQAAVFTRKLGLEFKAILGTVEAFDNFDKAAEGAAQLAQAFGMNIDAMQMVREQDPASRFEALRKSFFATGRAAEQMTRQELNLLAAQTGLSAEAVKLGFSAKSQAMSYDQVQKAADGASKKQLTQEEAMQKLANSIDRLVKSGSQLQGGFIQHFLSGFERGIMRSREFREMFWSIRRALRDTYWAGAQVGRMFVQLFPGVKQIFSGIADIFNRGRFQKFLSEIKETFFTFFRDISNNPQQGVQKFLNSLKDNFLNWFNGGAAQGSKVLEGVKTFFKAIVGIVAQLGRIAIEGLIDGAKALVKYIKNPTDLGINEAADGFMGTVIEIFGPLWDMLLEMLPQLGDALWELFTTALDWVWQKLQPYWEEYKWTIIGGMLLWFTGPAVLGAIAGAVTGLMVKAIGIGLANAATNGAFLRSTGGFWNAVTGARKVAAGADAAAASVSGAPPLGFWRSFKTTINTIASINPMQIAKAAFNIAIIIAFLAGGMYLLIQGIMNLAERIQSSKLTAASIMLSTLVVGAAGAIITALALTAKSIAMGGPEFAAGITGLGPLSLFLLGMIGLMGLLGLGIYALTRMGIQELEAGTIALGVITLVLLAMIPLTQAAAGISAEIIATGGVGALAALAGLGAITIFALAAVEAGKRIVDAASEISLSAGLQEKVEILVSVLGTLASLAGAVAAISASSALSTITGEDSFKENLEQVTQLVTDIKDTAIRFINEVKGIASQLTPTELQNLTAVLSILESLGSFVGSMSEATKQSLVAPLSDFMGIAPSVDEFNQQFDNLLITIAGSTTAPGFARIVQEALSIMNEIPGTPEQIASSAKALGDVLSSLGNFLTNVSGIVKGVPTEEGDKIRGFIESMTRNLLGGQGGGIFGTALQSILRNLGNFAREMSADDLKKVEEITKFIGPLFTSLGDISKAVASLGGGAIRAATSGATGIDPAAISNLGTVFTSIFNALRDFLPTLITNLNTTLSGIDATSLGTKVKALTPIFAFITTVQDAFAKFYWTVRGAGSNPATAGGPTLGDWTALAAGLANIQALFETSRPNNFFSILRTIIQGLQTSLTPDLMASINRINLRSINRLKTIMDAVKTITDAISSMKSTFLTATGEIGAGFSGAGIHNMIAPIASVLIALTQDRFRPYGGATEFTLQQLLDNYQTMRTDKLSNAKNILTNLSTFSSELSSFKSSTDSVVNLTGAEIHRRIAPIASVLIALTQDRFRPGGASKEFLLKDLLANYQTMRTDKLSNAKDILTNFSSIATEIGNFRNATASIMGLEGLEMHRRIEPIAYALIALSMDSYGGDTLGAGLKLSDILSNYSALNTESISNASSVLNSFATLAGNMTEFKNSFDPAMFSDNSWITTFFGAVTTLAGEVARVNNDLINLAAAPVEIAANLQAIGDSLGRDMNYRIETGTINFSINLRVNLKADDVANILIDKEYVTPGAKGTRFVD